MDCDDGDVCTKNVCNPVDATCEYPPAEDGILCAEGWCLAGRCEPIGSVFPCNELGIRAAIEAGGGPYTFACVGPTTVITEGEIVIDNDVLLDGEGNLEVSGNFPADPVISVDPTVAAELRGFTISRSAALEHYSRRDLVNQGTLTLTNSTVRIVVELGVAIHNTGSMTLTNSTTIAKSGVRAISNFGTMTLTNSTVSADAESGIAISNSGTIALKNSTVNGVRNVAVVVGATATVANSLIDGGCGTGDITSNGYNIESPGNTCGFDQEGDQANVSAEALNLGPLQDNGGLTETHALLPASVAIDAIPEAMCEVDRDQRGEPRPGGTMCDVGSFEVQP